MSAQTTPDILSAVEGEFAKPCAVKVCDRQATWAVWFKHGPATCPAMLYFCLEHKVMAFVLIQRCIDTNAPVCAKCDPNRIERMAGKPLDNYVRGVPL